jgi:hypothetical protein
LPQPYANSYSNSYRNTGNAYANSYSNNNATALPDGDSNCYGFAERDADTLGDPASTDAKAAAHAVSSADALRMKDPDSRVIGDQ